MSLRDDLLVPISGNNPSGENLRYAPIFDKIKEARRKEDPIAQGDWQRALKEADYRLVIKLSTEALKRNSKDLQVTAWLTEALVHQERLSGLNEGLNLLRGLLENFWDTLYPEVEDGDLELRAGPLSWVGEYRDLEVAVRGVPLTNNGLDWFKYRESRTVGYEADLGESDSKRQARRTAIAEGKLTAEEFDAQALGTPIADFEQLVADAEESLESLRVLNELCEQKFGDDAPSFRGLRTAIEDVQHTARMLLASKREKEPQPEPEPEAESLIEESALVSTGVAAAATARAPLRKGITAEPVDRDDAFNRVVAAAAYMRREEPNSPVPYLLLRGLRWGELRASAEGLNPELLQAPTSEIRQQLKRLMLDGEWDQVLTATESAMGLPCGRAWLDLQRYAVRACSELGSYYDAIASAIRSELRALLRDFPQLPAMTLLDDTSTANAETQSWLAEFAEPAVTQAAEMIERVSTMEEVAPATGSSQAAVVDPYELSLDAARAGNTEEAMQILAEQIAHERSGRGRFLRRTQLAQICIFSNRHTIAYPILQDLAQEIDTRKLEGWEQPEAIAQTLALLLQSMQKLRFGEDEKRKIYAQICRLDPVQAARMAD